MEKITDAKIDHIVTTLQDLAYGSVVVTVHDGEITQIDTTEKKRFSLTKSKSYEKKR